VRTAELSLEYIGESQESRVAVYGRVVSDVLGKDVSARLIGGSRPRMPWVAKINGWDPEYGYYREFLRPRWIRGGANGTQSRGVRLVFTLEVGSLYQYQHYTSWKARERCLCVVTNDGQLKRLTDEEGEAWLKRG